jgi:HlyD family secretion protein
MDDSPRRRHCGGLSRGSPRLNRTVRPAGWRRFAWPLAIVLLLVAGAAWWLRDRGEGGARYRTDAVARGDLSVAISATGNLEALSTIVIGTQVSGTIERVEVDFNDPVTRGQVLARIDPATVQARAEQAGAGLASARAQLAQAQAALRNAEADYARKRDLLARQLIARADADAALAQRDQARAQVTSAQASIRQQQATVDSAQTDIGYTVIRSPVDGVVLERAVEPGQTVAASLQTPVLFRIAEDLRRMRIVLAVDEADIGRIRAGQAVDFTVDAFPDRRFTGTIDQVRLAAANTNNVVSYPVVVAVDNPDLVLLPGMTANAEIRIERRAGVLTVANAALRWRPAGAATSGQDTAERTARAGGGVGAELDRIAQTLDLDDTQRAALAQVQAQREQRQRQRQESGGDGPRLFGAPGGGRQQPTGSGEAMRRNVQQRMLEAYAPFRATLRPEQQARWDAALAGLGNQRSGTVYVLVEGAPVETRVRLGLSDGTRTEITGGDIGEGALAVTGEERATP